MRDRETLMAEAQVSVAKGVSTILEVLLDIRDLEVEGLEIVKRVHSDTDSLEARIKRLEERCPQE